MNFNGMILFSRPSFTEGLVRMLDFGGTLNEYNTSLSPGQADYLAILADWKSVGDAIRQAGTEYSTNPSILVEQESE